MQILDNLLNVPVAYNDEQNIFECNKDDINKYYKSQLTSNILNSKTTQRRTIMGVSNDTVYIEDNRVFSDLEKLLDKSSLFFMEYRDGRQFILFIYNRVVKEDKRFELDDMLAGRICNFISYDIEKNECSLSICEDTFSSKELKVKKTLKDRAFKRKFNFILIKKIINEPYYFNFSDIKNLIEKYPDIEKILMKKHTDFYQAIKLNLL